MSRADLILLAVAGYIAVMSLVRLMKARRDMLVADVQKQVEAHRRRKPPVGKNATEKREAA
jgi:hypothetical protein